MWLGLRTVCYSYIHLHPDGLYHDQRTAGNQIICLGDARKEKDQTITLHHQWFHLTALTFKMDTVSRGQNLIVCSYPQSTMTRQVHENHEHHENNLCTQWPELQSEATYSPFLWFRSFVSCLPAFFVELLFRPLFWVCLSLKSSKVLGCSVFHPLW